MITAWASCHIGSPVDGKVCQLQAENPFISAVQIYRATSDMFGCGGTQAPLPNKNRMAEIQSLNTDYGFTTALICSYPQWIFTQEGQFINQPVVDSSPAAGAKQNKALAENCYRVCCPFLENGRLMSAICRALSGPCPKIK